MKDWKNTLIGTLAGAVVTLTVMFVSTTRTMVTKDQLEDLATKTEISIVQESIQNSMSNHTRAIESLAKEVHNLREQVGRIEGKLEIN